MDNLRIFTMDEVQSEPVSWLWEPYIPSGKITIVQGDPGDGKTTLMLAVSAAVTNGNFLPGSGDCTAPANVIYQTAEDGISDTIKPRLEQLGADCSRIHVIDESEQSLSLADERIEQAIIKTNAKLLIIDPIQAYLGGADMHSAKGMRPLMKSLGAAAGRNDCAVVIIGHLNKRNFGTKAQYRGLGSIDIYAAARSVLTVVRIGTAPNMRVVVQNKSNLAPPGISVAFTLDPIGGFSWHGEFDMNADDMFNNNPNRTSRFDEAKLFIQTILANGAVEATKIMEMAEEQGISIKTLNRAKSVLGVNSVKRNGQWYWEMPLETHFTGCDEDSQDAQDGHMALLTTLTMLNESAVM